MSKKFLLSVRLMTYMHEFFIRDALIGIDRQVTDFDFEVVVGDDFSDDNTLQIIKNFKFQNPNVHLNVLDRPKGGEYWKARKKYGRLYNFYDIINNCKGEYIALLDGDDYWIDPNKLQKQVEFLKKNLSYSFCSHFYFQRKGEILKKVKLPYNQVSLENIFYKNIYPTASLVFRSKIFNDIPLELLRSLPAGDWAIQAIACRSGKGYALDDYMSVYRIHGKGIWNSLSSVEMGRKGIEVLNILKTYFTDSYEQQVINAAIENRKNEFNLNSQGNLLKIVKKVKFKIYNILRFLC